MNIKNNQKESNFFIETLFCFSSLKCECRVETHYIDPEEEPKTSYKMCAESGVPLKFIFAPSKGLMRINSVTGKCEEENVLGAFLSINSNDLVSFVPFFNENGFLFPVSIDRYEDVIPENIQDLQKRISSLIDLLSEIGSKGKIDFEKVFESVCSILFSKDISIQIPSQDFSYHSYKHQLIKEISNENNLSNMLSKKEAFQNGCYHIKDSIYGDFILKACDYDRCISNADNPNLKIFTNLFANDNQCSEDLKIQIDFFFHFFFENINPHKMNNKMKAALLKIAKDICKKEIDWNVKGVSAIYDQEKLKPGWDVDSLLTAMYFSIFYLDSNVELMKKCENPRCGRYFKVARTMSKKKYCSEQCRNRALQARHRLSLKNRNEKMSESSL